MSSTLSARGSLGGFIGLVIEGLNPSKKSIEGTWTLCNFYTATSCGYDMVLIVPAVGCRWLKSPPGRSGRPNGTCRTCQMPEENKPAAVNTARPAPGFSEFALKLSIAAPLDKQLGGKTCKPHATLTLPSEP